MAKTSLFQWSTTAASNTDLNSIDITGATGLVKNGDNAIREMMAQLISAESKGSNVASASTVTLGTGRFFHITGTTTITDIDFTDAVDGRWAVLEFDGALTLTHNATTLTLPGGANITTAAGDRAFIVQDSGDNMHVLFYQTYASGTSYLPLAGGTMTGQVNFAPTVTIASASTVNIGAAASNEIIISGTTTITAFDTVAAGITREVLFSGALTLTHNGTSLILPGSANITTAANDTAAFRSLGSGNWVCLWYKKANGTAVVATATGPTTARNTVDQSISANTTLTDATNLGLSVSAATNYSFRFTFRVTASSNTTAGLKVAVTCPASPTRFFYQVNIVPATTTAVSGASASSGGAVAITTTTASEEMVVTVFGVLINGANAGTIQLQVAQSTSNVNATTLRSGGVGEMFPIS